MLIKGATWDEINDALLIANESFSDNLKFKRLDEDGYTRNGRPKFQVTITVHDSKEPGARRSYTDRRMSAACWHAHGTFFDALPEGTEIVAMGRTIHPGNRWIDFNVGSDYQPLYASEACECGL